MCGRRLVRRQARNRRPRVDCERCCREGRKVEEEEGKREEEEEETVDRGWRSATALRKVTGLQAIVWCTSLSNCVGDRRHRWATDAEQSLNHVQDQLPAIYCLLRPPPSVGPLHRTQLRFHFSRFTGDHSGRRLYRLHEKNNDIAPGSWRCLLNATNDFFRGRTARVGFWDRTLHYSCSGCYRLRGSRGLGNFLSAPQTNFDGAIEAWRLMENVAASGLVSSAWQDFFLTTNLGMSMFLCSEVE